MEAQSISHIKGCLQALVSTTTYVKKSYIEDFMALINERSINTPNHH